MNKKYFYLLAGFLILISPILVLADGGMHIWPPTVYLDQSAQNAIVAWNGEEEVLILSADIESSDTATVLRMVALPSNPSEIEEGSFDSFEKLVAIMNQKIEAMREFISGGGEKAAANEPSGIEITFQQIIGAHDVTVVKVDNLDDFLDWIKDFASKKGFPEKQISSDFKVGISNYLKRDIKYFVFDVIEAGKKKESIKPLIYRFKNSYLYYPLLISGISEISESKAYINLFLVAKKEINLVSPNFYYYGIEKYEFYNYNITLTKEELKEVSDEVASLFEDDVRVTKIDAYSKLIDLKKDLMLFPSLLWDENLMLGSRGEKVKSLQKMLINEGVWDSEVEATGYFGPITKAALIKFQERYRVDILRPLNLEKGTGYFGPKSRAYLNGISLSPGM